MKRYRVMFDDLRVLLFNANDKNEAEQVAIKAYKEFYGKEGKIKRLTTR